MIILLILILIIQVLVLLGNWKTYEELKEHEDDE